MKNVNLKQQIPKHVLIPLAIAVGGLLLGLIGYLGLVSPAKSQLSTVNKELDVARTSLITAENTPPPPKLPPAQASDIFRLTKAMPNTDDLPGILIALSKLAKQSSVSMQSVTPSADVTSTSGYTSIPLAVVLSGTYPEVMHFLQAIHHTVTVTPTRLEVRSRLFIANGVTLSSQGSTVNANVTMAAYTYTPSTAAAATTTDTTTTTPTT